jgi:4,5-DOPA dioxygenase extradiol
MHGTDMLPALFVSHGSPMIALDGDGAFARALGAFGSKHRPRAAVVISAHWQTRDVRVTASPKLIYDFGGFPDELYRIAYPCQGEEALAAEIARELGARPEERGLDHGAWVPLRFLWPEADVPVVQVSLPRAPHDELRAIGERLARFEGVLLLGSGGIVHNLRLLHWDDRGAPVDPWAREFDEWAWRNLGPGFDHAKGPNAERAVPTTEHMDPVYCVLGAASGEKELVFEGFEYGNLSMRSFSMKPVAAR